MARGMGTYVLAANAPEGAKVVSVDLPADLRGEYTERCLHRDEIGRIALQSKHAGKITVHFEDSRRIDPDRLRAMHGPFDFVLVDGDHSYAAVKNDSELAFRVLAPSGVVLWHDLYTFLPPAPQRGLFQYLSELAATDRNVRHIAGTYFGVMKGDWSKNTPGSRRQFKSGEGPFAERIVRVADADWPHAEWHGKFLARQNVKRVFDLGMDFNVARYAEAGDTDISAPGHMQQVYVASLYHADDRPWIEARRFKSCVRRSARACGDARCGGFQAGIWFQSAFLAEDAGDGQPARFPGGSLAEDRTCRFL